MKKIMVICSLILCFPFLAQSKTVMPAIKLKIASPDGLTLINGLTAKISIRCRYSSGIFWPVDKACGLVEKSLLISNSGDVMIPKTETFSGWNANNIQNYEIIIKIYEGQKILGEVSASGVKAIGELTKNNKELNILRFESASLGLTKDGGDFFGSEFALDRSAYLLVLITTSLKTKSSLDTIRVTSSPDYFYPIFFNKTDRGLKILLKDIKEIKFPETSLAYLGDEKNIKIHVNVDLSVTHDLAAPLKFKGSVTVPADSSAFKDIGSIELK